MEVAQQYTKNYDCGVVSFVHALHRLFMRYINAIYHVKNLRNATATLTKINITRFPVLFGSHSINVHLAIPTSFISVMLHSRTVHCICTFMLIFYTSHPGGCFWHRTCNACDSYLQAIPAIH